MGSISDRVTQIVRDQFDTRIEITPDTRLIEDLDCDSLDCVEMLMEMEDEFSISIPDDAGEAWKTVGDMVRYAENHPDRE
jgi:acyl carrier protein